MKSYEQFISKFDGRILHNELLCNHSSFKIGGPADVMAFAGNTAELKYAVELCLEMDIQFFLLGGGTNVVFHDRGFRGVVIKNLCKNYKIEEQKVFVESGVPVSLFAEILARKGLKGLEGLGGLPGTVGGAIVGNAGAYGSSIGHVLSGASIFLMKEKKVIEVEKDFFDFRYRYSKLKSGEIKAVILSAILHLDKGDPKELLKVIEKDRYKRVTLHPTEPSAGCIFKNIETDEKFREYLKNKIPGIPPEQLITYNKLPAGKLIDILGLKGITAGDAKVSTLHGNYIVNTGKATSAQVKELIHLIKQKVKEEFDIDLEEEIVFIPENL